MGPISFPGLGLSFTINRIAFQIGSWSVSWYGIIIAVGLLLALIYGMRRSKLFGITGDDLADVVIYGIIAGIIGARLYYVLFYIDPTTGSNPYFADPKSMLYIWNGGLGIYGGIIAAFAAAFIVAKIKKISVGAVFDIAALGFLIGQAIGRWGNFVNQEAYGSATNLPWRMVVSSSSSAVHPCFLYESLWCILGFVLLHTYSKRRKFSGEVFLMYISWYAFGRFFIEGLRSDSLMIGNFKVTQVVAVIFFCASIGLIIYKRMEVKKAAQESVDYTPMFEETSKALEEEKALLEIEKNKKGEYSGVDDTDKIDNNNEVTEVGEKTSSSEVNDAKSADVENTEDEN